MFQGQSVKWFDFIGKIKNADSLVTSIEKTVSKYKILVFIYSRDLDEILKRGRNTLIAI